MVLIRDWLFHYIAWLKSFIPFLLFLLIILIVIHLNRYLYIRLNFWNRIVCFDRIVCFYRIMIRIKVNRCIKIKWRSIISILNDLIVKWCLLLNEFEVKVAVSWEGKVISCSLTRKYIKTSFSNMILLKIFSTLWFLRHALLYRFLFLKNLMQAWFIIFQLWLR